MHMYKKKNMCNNVICIHHFVKLEPSDITKHEPGGLDAFTLPRLRLRKLFLISLSTILCWISVIAAFLFQQHFNMVALGHLARQISIQVILTSVQQKLQKLQRSLFCPRLILQVEYARLKNEGIFLTHRNEHNQSSQQESIYMLYTYIYIYI